MNCIINGKLVNYSVNGKGKRVVLLLHGWGDSLTTFRSLDRVLCKKYTVVALDLPGFGGSEAPAEAWDLDDYSQFLSVFLTKIDRRGVYGIIGHSNGGAVAIRALSMGTIKSKKVVLLAASGIRSKAGFNKKMLKLITKTGSVLTFWLPLKYRQKLQKALYGTIGSDFLAVPNMKETFKKTISQDVKEDAAALEIPTLLIYGDKDRATPPKFGRVYNDLIKGSRLEIVRGADHFVHHSNSNTVAELVSSHFEAKE